jgi:hypothetical protein
MTTIDDWFHATGGRFTNIGVTAWSVPPTTTPLALGVWGLGATCGVSGLIDDGSPLPSGAIPAADSYASKAGVLGGANTDTGVAGIANGVGVFGQNGKAPGLSTGRKCGVLGASVTFGATGVVGESLIGTGVLGTTGRKPPMLPDMVAGVIGAADRNVGVFGMSNSRVGVFGFCPDRNGVGVFAEGDGDGGVGIFAQASGPNGTGVHAEALATGAKAGDFRGDVDIVGDVKISRRSTGIGGNLVVAGTVTAMIKNAIVPFPDGTTRVLHCMESPEHWFEDFGTARLERGRAVVKLDADFAKTIRAGDYRVFLTPEGDCRGLYIGNRRSATFEVRELQGGTSSVAFSYRIVGRRKDIKKHRRFARVVIEPPEPPATRTRLSMDALLAKVRKQAAAKPVRAGRRKTARVPQRLSALLATVRKQARANSARQRKRAERA